jgi:hypothetical protein
MAGPLSHLGLCALHSALQTLLCGEMAELAEGARLLSEYTLKKCIEGSNPSLSAIRCAPHMGWGCSWQAIFRKAKGSNCRRVVKSKALIVHVLRREAHDSFIACFWQATWKVY